MDITHKGFVTKNSYQVMREAGYFPIQDSQSGKQSYILRLTANRYPRFHVYVEEENDDEVKLHLHLDHRRHGFGERLHDSEYKGERVEAEAGRLKRWLAYFTVQREGKNQQETNQDGGFFSKLFG